MTRVYEEVVDFLAAGTDPEGLIAFRPSEAARQRLLDPLHRQKSDTLTPEERSELEHYLTIEHLMRLAKARARKHSRP